MDAVGLDASLASQSPFALSGGQKRRVAIAGVIAMRPDVLVLDEPTAGLDPAGRDEILSLVKRYHDQSGATVLIVSHSMEDIARPVSYTHLASFGRRLHPRRQGGQAPRPRGDRLRHACAARISGGAGLPRRHRGQPAPLCTL